LYDTHYVDLLRIYYKRLRSRLARERLAAANCNNLENAMEIAMNAEIDELEDFNNNLVMPSNNFKIEKLAGKIKEKDEELDNLK